jgi:eukaryotic-like serine/threonine-protein kinase
VQDDRTVVRLGLGPGTRLNGIYEIERLIAVGGMGEIYKGRAIETGDAVAIKTIRPDLASNEAALALFRKEAAALHNLFHEAIVRYYVFSVDPVLRAPYLAMEYVDGEPLSELLKQGPLGAEAVRVLQRRLASGLQAAHELGIIHRDVSPDNVILPAGQVQRAKIIDFGIARSTLLGEATVIGSGFAGKYAYVSPEQLGLYGGEVTARSDIYSLGLVLAQALTGRPLDMGGTQAEVVEKRRRVPDLSGLDPGLRPLIERMLQPKPADRIATMAEVAAWQPVMRAPKRKTVPLNLGGGLAAAAIAGAVILVLPQIRSPQLSASPPGQSSDVPNGASSVPTLQAAPDPSPPPRNSTPAGGEAAQGAADLRPRQDPATATPPSSAAQDVRPPLTAEMPPVTPTVAPGDMSAGRQQAAQANVPVIIPPANPSPAEPASLAPAERIARYVRDYEGGDCFFLTPTSLGSSLALLEGFGTSPTPFEAFDQAFKLANGFEAQISVRLITDAQCPAVSFMRKVGIDAARAPKLQIASFTVRGTDPLSGTVDDAGGRHVDVLLVSDDGYAYSLAEYTKREGGTAKFSLRLKGTSGQRPKPQMVLAIASPQPLTLLNTAKPIAADSLFPLLIDEARAQGMTLDLAVKYFRLEG